MSGIALNSFISSARLAQDGDVRISKGSEDSLVNKGTFGQKVAQFFSGVGNAIRGFRPDADERAQRQEATFTAFEAALTDEYGETAAKDALRNLKPEQGPPRLTGRAMLAAIDIARGRQATINATNLIEANARFQAPRGQTGGAGLIELGSRLEPPIDPRTFSTAQRAEYTDRLMEGVAIMSDRGRKPLEPDQIEQIAKTALKQVAKLGGDDGVERAQTAKQAYVDTLKAALKEIGSGGNAASVMARLEKAMAGFMENAKAELLGGEPGMDDFQDLTEKALRQAIHELRQEDPKALGKAQERALASDSPLRALFASASNALGPTGPWANSQKTTAYGYTSMVQSLVSGLARERGALTGSEDGDLQRLYDDTTITPDARLDMDQALARRLDTLVGPGAFLRVLKERYNNDDDQGRPAWHSPRVFGLLDQQVRERIDRQVAVLRETQQGDVSHEQASQIFRDTVKDFREAIDSDQELPRLLKMRLREGLEAIETEDRLASTMSSFGRHLRQNDKENVVSGFQQENIWRIFADKQQQESGKSNLLHSGRPLAGMQTAFAEMLAETGFGQEIDGAFLERMAQTSLKSTPSRGEYRTRADDVVIKKDDVTQDGLKELRQQSQTDDWLGEVWLHEGSGEVELKCPSRSAEECRDRADKIFATFNADIAKAGSDDEKRMVVAKTVQDLVRSHLFSAGNSDVVAFSVMNRMLLEAGLSPAVLDNPRGAGGCSQAELAEEIRKGQETFGRMRIV